MSFVIDNSMAMAWTLPDEWSPAADAVLDRVVNDGGHIPFHFPAEFANGLTMAVRKGRIDERARSAASQSFSMLNLVRDLEGVERMGAAIELADLYRLTIYDALYLELAQRLALPLATLDDALARATQRAGVALAVSLS
ncbi:type II toxin-antitoxin system VapC family toxin [Mesorhizobium sp. IMUNJ 23232]|uniref:type II toxin-antitoxin system VapC family toxin n=1 Tax=Mesorhizobium sp. IMUNJ 23232 TaxID=3376064 RepID=UPI003790134C